MVYKKAVNFINKLTTHPSLRRFLRYTFSGGTSTLIDLFLLWFLTDVAGLFYLISASVSFIMAISINYQVNHFWGFRETRREFLKGYLLFFSFGIMGLGLTISLMAIFVEYFEINYLVSRILIALFIGFWNYVMNVNITFKANRS